jgi:hypothetical protein
MRTRRSIAALSQLVPPLEERVTLRAADSKTVSSTLRGLHPQLHGMTRELHGTASTRWSAVSRSQGTTENRARVPSDSGWTHPRKPRRSPSTLAVPGRLAARSPVISVHRRGQVWHFMPGTMTSAGRARSLVPGPGEVLHRRTQRAPLATLRGQPSSAGTNYGDCANCAYSFAARFGGVEGLGPPSCRSSA